jgi:putative DNA primase/helicase
MSYEDEEFRAAQIADGGDWQSALQKTDKGNIKPNMTNAYLLLRWALEGNQWLAYDEFAGEPVVLGETPWRRSQKTWQDADALAARLRLNSLYGVDLPNPLVHDAAELVARDNAFHPVKRYLTGLKWDGRFRINEWLMRYLGAVTTHGGDCRQYLGSAGSMWLMGAVARIMDPGCRFDYVLIFEGRQGAFKSTALRILGGDWTLDTPIVIGDKDAFQMLRGKWIVELAELDSLNKAESTKAKAFFSSPTDTYRASYGRRAADVPRQCVFAGTTNEEAYMRDGTGNRRYWPVLATTILPDELRRDRDQLWAEALVQYQEGIPYWPDDDQRPLFEIQQSLRLIEDPWEAVIGLWLAQPEIALEADTEGISTHAVLTDALKIDPGKLDERAMQMRVAKSLKNLGFTRRQIGQRKGLSGSRYVYVRLTSPEGRDENVQ